MKIFRDDIGDEKDSRCVNVLFMIHPFVILGRAFQWVKIRFEKLEKL